MKRKFLLLSMAVVSVVAVLFVFSGASISGNNPSWFVRCNNTAPEDVQEKRGQCEIFQAIQIAKTNQRITEFAIGFPADQENARGIIILPLGVLLSAGVQMQIDQGQAYKFSIRYCTDQGCFAFISLNEDVLAEMRKGKEATIRFQSIKPQVIEIKLSLQGFAKALDEIS